jgi:cell division protein FtsB
MSAAGSYHPPNVDDRDAPPQLDPEDPRTPDAGVDPSDGAATPVPADGIDLSALSIAGITRRRVGWVAAALVSAWIVVIFARQATEAATAAGRADQIARDNAALAAEVAALENELATIEQPQYITQQARNYGLGGAREIAFTLDASVPSPGPDAPGSASTRVGTHEERITPLESWLTLLFGPSD